MATQTTENKQALIKSDNVALLTRVYGSANNALTFTAKVKGTDKHGKDKITKKKVTLSCDTVIGNFEKGELYTFTVNAYIGATPKKVLGLTLDYDGQITTFVNQLSIATGNYSVDDFKDNVLLSTLAIELLGRLSILSDGAINLFFDLLRLNGFEFELTKDNLPILSKVKLDQTKILELFVKNGANCLAGSPLRLIADQCKGLLTASTK